MSNHYYKVMTNREVGKPVITIVLVEYEDENFHYFDRTGNGNPEEVKMIFTKHTNGNNEPKWILKEMADFIHADEDDEEAYDIEIVLYEYDGEETAKKAGGKSSTIKVKDAPVILPDNK